MADVNTPDAIPATNASNTTRYFNLPLFLATDKPSWLVDWNGAMGQIDSILEDIATASEGAVADVHTIQTQIDALNAIIPKLEATVQTAVKDVAAMQTTIASHETRMDSIEQDLITQNNLIKTLSDSVVAMQSTVATLTNRVAAMESSISTMGTNVDAINAELSTIRSSMNNLDSRVTALEQHGTDGMPAISDITWQDVSYNFTQGPTTVRDHLLFTAEHPCYVRCGSQIMTNDNPVPQVQIFAYTDTTDYRKTQIFDANNLGSTINNTRYPMGSIFKLNAGDHVYCSFERTGGEWGSSGANISCYYSYIN